MHRSRLLLAGLLVLVVLTGATAVAAAAVQSGDDRRSAGTHAGGTVVIEGPVDGDVQVVGGTVVVSGAVDGDVQVYAGVLQVTGEVDGDLEAFAGTVVLDGRVSGDVSVAAGTLAVDGRVGGSVRSAAARTLLGENADVAGDVRYAGDLDRAAGSAVGGTVSSDPTLRVGPVLFPPVSGPFLAAFVILAHLSMGALLLLAFPGYARTVGERIAAEPLVAGVAGLGVLVGAPLAVGLLAVTIVGIPLALTGLFAYLVLLWVGTVYGRFALGYWAVGLAGRDSPWLGLLVGVVGVGVLLEVPALGPALQFVTLVLGLGALGVSGVREFRRRRGAASAATGGARAGEAGASEAGAGGAGAGEQAS